MFCRYRITFVLKLNFYLQSRAIYIKPPLLGYILGGLHFWKFSSMNQPARNDFYGNFTKECVCKLFIRNWLSKQVIFTRTYIKKVNFKGF